MLEQEPEGKFAPIYTRPIGVEEFYQPFLYGFSYIDEPVSVRNGAIHISEGRMLRTFGAAEVRIFEKPIGDWMTIDPGTGCVHPMDYSIEARVRLYDTVRANVQLGCLVRTEEGEYYAEGRIEKRVADHGEKIREIIFDDWKNDIFESQTPVVRTAVELAAMQVRFQL